MIDSRLLAKSPSQELSTSDEFDLEQRLGLYRVFLKLYEHHRGLLDEILELENTNARWHVQHGSRFVQGVVQGAQVYLITNLLKENTQLLQQAQQTWVIGRDRTAALPIQDKCLSRRHAAIQYVADEGFYLIDLDSTNGTFVNGETFRQAVRLKDGDRVRLGSLTFTFLICNTVRTERNIPPDLLAQIDSARQASSPQSANLTDTSSSGMEVGWHTPLPDGAKDTSMFLRPSIPRETLPLEMPAAQFSVAQQTEILDRFLNR